jgi:hypothetical protein
MLRVARRLYAFGAMETAEKTDSLEIDERPIGLRDLA